MLPYIKDKLQLIYFHLKRAYAIPFVQNPHSLGVRNFQNEETYSSDKESNLYIQSINLMNKNAEVFITYLCLLEYDLTDITKQEIISVFTQYDTEDKFYRGIPLCI